MWSPKFGLILALAGLWSLPDALRENQQHFEAMNPDAQREMVRKWERFSNLPETEKERWRAFDQQLAQHPDAEDLRAVMEQYYEWNLALSDRDRATLSLNSVDKRMELVQKIRLKQYEENLGNNESNRLTLDELKILLQWFRETVVATDRNATPPTPADWDVKLDDLQSRFSGKTAELMAQKKGKVVDGRDERWTLVWNWRLAIARPSSAMLKSVYESLTEDERVALSDLQDMTPDAINDKLREYYFDRIELRMGRGPGRGPGGGNDRGRPSERRPIGPPRPPGFEAGERSMGPPINPLPPAVRPSNDTPPQESSTR